MTQIQEPMPGQSASTWEQDVNVGGEDAFGEPARVALAVSQQGIANTRNVPTIAAAANSVPIGVGETKNVIGKTTQRRRLTIIAMPTAGAGTYGAQIGQANTSEQSRSNGLALPQGVPMPVSSAGEVWVTNTSAAAITVSYWAELDNG